MRAAKSVKRPGPRCGSERCENAAWEKVRPHAKRLFWQPQGRAGEKSDFFSSLLGDFVENGRLDRWQRRGLAWRTGEDEP